MTEFSAPWSPMVKLPPDGVVPLTDVLDTGLLFGGGYAAPCFLPPFSVFVWGRTIGCGGSSSLSFPFFTGGGRYSSCDLPCPVGEKKARARELFLSIQVNVSSPRYIQCLSETNPPKIVARPNGVAMDPLPGSFQRTSSTKFSLTLPFDSQLPRRQPDMSRRSELGAGQTGTLFAFFPLTSCQRGRFPGVPEIKTRLMWCFPPVVQTRHGGLDPFTQIAPEDSLCDLDGAPVLSRSLP